MSVIINGNTYHAWDQIQVISAKTYQYKKEIIIKKNGPALLVVMPNNNVYMMDVKAAVCVEINPEAGVHFKFPST